MFCITSQGDTSQLHLATQQFHSFYHHIASNLVVAPLSGHVTNITLHQYHRATYAVKKFHSKAMIKGTIKWNRTFDADFSWGLGFWRCVFGFTQRSAKKQSKPKDRRQKTTFFPGKSAELNGTVRSLYFSLNTFLISYIGYFLNLQLKVAAADFYICFKLLKKTTTAKIIAKSALGDFCLQFKYPPVLLLQC